MLTDYHVHLRGDELGASAASHFTAANAARYRQAAQARGIAELGVSEHIYRFKAALEIWDHPFWVVNATDDLDAHCRFVREQSDLRLGIEADFISGAEERIAALLGAHDFDYVVGSVHFIALDERESASVLDGGGAYGTAEAPRRWAAVDMEDFGVWRGGLSAEEIWQRYFATLAEAAACGLFDILAHPDLVKVFGAGQPRPSGDLGRFYEPAVAAIAKAGVAIELSTAGLRKAAGEIYPSEQFLRMCLREGVPVALSSDAHSAEQIGFGYEQALELLRRHGVGEVAVFQKRRRSLAPLGRDA